MKSIQGKIVAVKPGKKHAGLIRIAVEFKAVALLPDRTDVPGWLTDHILTVEREVADVREIGSAGDAISLTVAESEKWLLPLSIDPPAIEGPMPKSIGLTLRWWKNDSPPRFTMSATGKKVVGSFARRGKNFAATVPTKGLLDIGSPGPTEISATCDTLRAYCPLTSPADAGFCQFLDRRGEGFKLLNAWYAADVSSAGGGAIAGLRERGRDVDHLAGTMETQKPFERSGHTDRVFIAGNDKLAESKLAFTLCQREAGSVRVEMDGLIDEGKNVRSAVAYRLYGNLPLLIIRRDARVFEAKPDEKKKEPTDSLVPIQLGFRHATTLEGDGIWGSQIIAADGDRLGVIRAMYENEHAQRGEWWLKSGCVLIHHPLRRQATLLLIDGEHPPELSAWAGTGFVTVEPSWLGRPYRPPGGMAFTLGLSAGEVCGASLQGTWVACQSQSDGQSVACAAIAKLANPHSDAVAEFRLGREKRTATLVPTFLEGVGEAHYAVAHFPPGRKVEMLDATVAGIPSRSKP